MQQPQTPAADSGNTIKLVIAWLFVGIPFAWGVIKTLGNVVALFK